MTSVDQDDWSFATARVPSQFTAAVHPPAPNTEHALGHDETLCGIARENVTVYRHLFYPGGASACLACRERAAAAPTQPSAHERLHNRVLAAAPGQVRDELIGALRRGARIKLWIEGPAASLAKHHVSLGQIVEGDSAVAAVLRTEKRIGLAKVKHGPWRFVIVLPHDRPPLVARATAEQ